MTLRSAAVTLVVLAATTSAACSGRLKVGDKTPLEGGGGDAGAETETGGTPSEGARAGGGAGGRSGGETAGTSGGLNGASGSGAVSGSGGAGAAGGTAGKGQSGSGGTEAVAGSGASANASSSGGTSSLPEVPPQEPKEGSDDDCPIGPLTADSGCEALGQICGYQWEGSIYQECSCRRTGSGATRWSCHQFVGELGYCPDSAPEHASNCFGSFGLVCPYPPARECWCNASTEVWDCPTPVEPERPDPPADLDPERPVRDLDDAERERWCDWYGGLTVEPGYPPISNAPVDENGYALGGCRADDSCQAAVAVVSNAQCAANLAQSDCAAPLALLTECTGNLFSGGCGREDQECIELFDTPDCSGTIVTATYISSGERGCPVKVQ